MQYSLPINITLGERYFPHRLMDGVWLWSIFSEEKELFFNGYLIETEPGKSILIDPPCGGEEVLEAFRMLPRPERIIITNRDHERAASAFKALFQSPVYAHELDAPLLNQPPDQVYRDGELFPGGWQAILLQDQKSPGECALYQPQRRMLVLGDALIGQSTHHLSMLPSDKYASKRDALQGLQPLRKLAVITVLPCDGDPILHDGNAVIIDALEEAAKALDEEAYAP